MHSPLRFVFNRRELKFPLTSGLWQKVVDCAERYLPVERFDGVHGVVNIRTTYLDTPDFNSYREYQEARPVRRKVRIRQYGYDGQFDGACWVEIKIKRYRDSLKRRFGCSTEVLLDLMGGKDIRDHVVQCNPDFPEVTDVYRAARSMIVDGSLGPVVRVDYDRVSFQDPSSPEVRITVDRGIHFRNARQSKSAAYDGVVLEVKYDDGEPEWLGKFLRELDLFQSRRFSKFARAVKELKVDQIARRDSA